MPVPSARRGAFSNQATIGEWLDLYKYYTDARELIVLLAPDLPDEDTPGGLPENILRRAMDARYDAMVARVMDYISLLIARSYAARSDPD